MRYITTSEVAQILNVHPMTVFRWVKLGTIPGVRIGGRWRYREDDIFSMKNYEPKKKGKK